LSFARQKLGYCYFSAAATLYAPELSDARISWTKNGVLTTVVDDFFDFGGSMQFQLNVVEMNHRWEVDGSTDFCSEQVEILFTAIRGTILEIGGLVSFALGPIVLSALYLVGPKLSEEMVSSPEYKNLYEGVSTCGRLLNDWRGVQVK
ncbi:unnamed protein product, partial [Linum tenue]